MYLENTFYLSDVNNRSVSCIHCIPVTHFAVYILKQCDSLRNNHECYLGWYRGADKSLARPGRKQATATEDFDVHKSYL